MKKLATHEECNYRAASSSKQQCGNCEHFVPGRPPACTLVKPPIAATMLCDYWEKK